MSKTKTKNKVPMVINMVCNGEIQCPLCYASFSMPEGRDYHAGVMECPWCHKQIEIDTDTAEIGNAIINGRAVSQKNIEDVNVIRRVQWHLDTPVCRILSGIKVHLTNISIKELFFLYWNLGGESIDDLAEIMRELIRLRRKHKRSVKAA